MDDTIVAISTAIGVGAISIVRLSGKDSINIINKIFNKNLTKVKSHTIHYGYIIDNKEKIDEVMVSVMLAPKTYTKENIIEINCHGGLATTEKVLELCLNKGARLAEPGEFTKRAFLNGRIDLTEAEAVEDVIESENELARSCSINNLTGTLSSLINEERNTLIKLMSNIEVNIDYPEYQDNPQVTQKSLKQELIKINNKLQEIIDESNNTKIIKDGINIALVGRPNVGKSSLLNTFLEEQKAIVTPIAGTTRDLVEGSIVLGGIKLNFIDTAGIHETDDYIESIGVNKSINAINNADLIILVLNNNEELSEEDKKLFEVIKEKKYLVYINKNDLDTKIKLSQDIKVIYGNTLNNKGIKDLKEAIIKLLKIDEITNNKYKYLVNARQKDLILKTKEAINSASIALDNNTYVDMIESDLKEAFDYLGEILGVTYKDELIDEMFKNFCLGK